MNPNIEECESCCPGENIGPGKRYDDIYDWLLNSKKENGLSQRDEMQLYMDKVLLDELEKALSNDR